MIAIPVARADLIEAVDLRDDGIRADQACFRRLSFENEPPANAEDLELINKSCTVAVEMACKRVPGVVGMDENKDNELRCCEFPRIKGGKHFDITESWYVDMMAQLGQPIVPAQA